MLQPAEQQALIADFKAAVTGLYGDRLAKVILYGSYARGDAHEESDIDFLVVLKDKEVKRLAEVFKMSEVVHQLILEHDIEISYHPMGMDRFLNEKNGFLFWVRKEGIEV